MVKLVRVFGVAAVVALVAQGGWAQGLRDMAPAEVPPEGYAGAQYVDSRGCVFVRAGMSGMTNWVPRVSRSRRPICGFQPTDVSGSGPSSVRKAASGPVIAMPAAARPADNEGGRVSDAARSRPAPAPAPVATPPRSPVIHEAPAPQRMTKAEVCAGRQGVQSGYMDARTGQPVDCGGAPAPHSGLAPLRQVVAGGHRACLNAIAQGQAYAGTEGLRCGAQSQPVSSAGTVARPAPAAPAPRAHVPPVAPRAPAVPAAPATIQTAPSPWACLEAISRGFAIVRGPDGREMRCAPQSLSPSGRSSALDPTQSEPMLPSRAGEMVPARMVSSSRPRISGAQTPAGFVPIWKDGRLNPQRGISVARMQRGATTGSGRVYALNDADGTYVNRSERISDVTVNSATRVDPPRETGGKRVPDVAVNSATRVDPPRETGGKHATACSRNAFTPSDKC